MTIGGTFLNIQMKRVPKVVPSYDLDQFFIMAETDSNPISYSNFL